MQNFLAEIMNVHGAFNFHSRDLCVRNNSNWKKLQQNLIKLKTVEWGNSSFLFPCNNFGGLPVCVVNISHLFYPIFNIFDHSNSLNNITSSGGFRGGRTRRTPPLKSIEVCFFKGGKGEKKKKRRKKRKKIETKSNSPVLANKNPVNMTCSMSILLLLLQHIMYIHIL